MVPLDHRQRAYRLLAGDGLEIGAFNEPARLPEGARVRYFDVVDEREGARLFPEVDAASLVHVDFTGNLDAGGLDQFGPSSFDFVVANHVLEHLANPVGAVEAMVRVIRPGGHLVLSVPDKRYTFDRGREETTLEHLWLDYVNGVRENSDEHYVDFFRSAAPHVFAEPAAHLPLHIARSRSRRDHAHVWTSEGFRSFLTIVFARIGVEARCAFESLAGENQIEYFGLWQVASKGAPGRAAAPA